MASNDEMAANGASDCGVISDDIEHTGKTVEEGHELEITESVNEFSIKTWKEDLVLSVEGRKLYVSSHIMALISPVFSSMLEEAFKEEGTRQLEIPGRYDDVVEFLRCFYPGIMKPITMENAPLVAPLANTYKVESVKKLCEQFLIDAVKKEISPDLFCSVIQLASSCQMKHLRKHCAEELFRRDDLNLELAVKKLDLLSDFRQEILERKTEAYKNEVTILKQRLEEKSVRCAELEHIVTKTWAEELKIEHENTTEFGMIDMNYDYSVSVSKSMKLNNIYWIISSRIKRFGYATPDDFYVDVKASGDESWGKWSCKVQASCSVSNGDEWSWKKTSQTIANSGQLTFHFGEVHTLKRAWPEGFKITVCILV